MTCGGGASVTGVRPDAATVGSLYDIITRSGSRSLAVVGLVKNAGKTTVVNALMANCPHLFGLTSLGLDGERTDHLTGLAKPSIAPPAGTLVATTRGSLERSRYAMEALEELPFHTPLGHVVIGRAAGGGAVEVSGRRRRGRAACGTAAPRASPWRSGSAPASPWWWRRGSRPAA
jgi:hypothetical protein